MVNKILLVFIGFDVAFLLCATLHLVLPLYTRSSFANNNTVDNIANHLLLDNTPLTGKSKSSLIPPILRLDEQD